MEFRIRAMQEADAHAIALWHYDGSYQFYDLDQDPDDLAALLNQANWGAGYWAVDGDDGHLAGFFCFAPAGDDVTIGLGMRPDLTGQGLGLAFLEAGLAFARDRYAPAAFRLAVAAFNERAIRLYGKAGFAPIRTYVQATNGGQFAFVEMERSARPHESQQSYH